MSTDTMIEPKKLTADPTNAPGPIQTKRINKAASAVLACDHTTEEINGDVGGREFRSRVQKMTIGRKIEGTSTRTDAVVIYNAVVDRFDGIVSKSNAKDVLEALVSAYAEAEATIPVVDKRTTLEDQQSRAAANDARSAQAKIDAEKGTAILSEVIKNAPKGARSLIVAELHKDESDIMTDYFSHSVTRRVVIGYRTGTRENFNQLRRAAATFEPTAHLGPQAEKSVEHRENYSMGAGNYVKEGHNHSSGWAVRSERLPRCVEDASVWRWKDYEVSDAIKAGDRSFGAPASPGKDSSDIGGATVSEYHHAKRGIAFFLVVADDRLDREIFERVRSDCKRAGGWYSRKWGSTPGGFAFEDRDAAETFARDQFGSKEESDEGTQDQDSSEGLDEGTRDQDSSEGLDEGTRDQESKTMICKGLEQSPTDQGERYARVAISHPDKENYPHPYGNHSPKPAPGYGFLMACSWVPRPLNRSVGEEPGHLRTRAGNKDVEFTSFGWGFYAVYEVNGVSYNVSTRFAFGLGSDNVKDESGEWRRITHAPDQVSTATPDGHNSVHINRVGDWQGAVTDSARAAIRTDLDRLADELTTWSKGSDASALFIEERDRAVGLHYSQADEYRRLADLWERAGDHINGMDMLPSQERANRDAQADCPDTL